MTIEKIPEEPVRFGVAIAMLIIKQNEIIDYLNALNEKSIIRDIHKRMYDNPLKED